MKQKKTKLTYNDMLEVMTSIKQEMLIMKNEIFSVQFLINSLLEMNQDVDKLTDFIEGKIEKEKDDTTTDGKKKQAKGSRTTETSGKPS